MMVNNSPGDPNSETNEKVEIMGLTRRAFPRIVPTNRCSNLAQTAENDQNDSSLPAARYSRRPTVS